MRKVSQEEQPETYSSISGGKMGWSGSVTQHNCLYTQSYTLAKLNNVFCIFCAKIAIKFAVLN